MQTIYTNSQLLDDLNRFLKGTNLGLDAFKKYILKAKSLETKSTGFKTCR